MLNVTDVSSDILTIKQDQKIRRPANIKKTDRPFISVDSETYHEFDGAEEKVMLFGFSTGNLIKGPDISSFEMFQLIENVAILNQHRKPIYISYGFKYDVSFLLRDMPDNVAERIWKGETTWWKRWRIEYRREKYIHITSGRRDFKTKRRDGISVKIYECSSWFNKQRLDTAASKHLRHDPEYENIADTLRSGKADRGTFTYSELHYVETYWRAEQEIFVMLMNHLRDLFIKANLPMPKDWYGPSAATSTAFYHFGVKHHMRQQKDMPKEFVEACRYAYFGGRFEQFAGGFHHGTVYQYDIASAYPRAMVDLWSWKDATLFREYRFDRTKPFPASLQFACFELRYRGRGTITRPHPFPLRDKRGRIFFPPNVDGWYWSPEVKANWQNPDMEIKSAWVIHPGNGDKPFKWIGDFFSLRCKYKAEGNPAEYALKIVINAGYGKTAQRVGWRRNEKTGENFPPPYHQLDWAGYITSYTRAMIWEAIIKSRGSVFQVETDGIFSTKPIDLPLIEGDPFPIPSDLGKWERTIHHGMITVQNGVYWMLKEDGQWQEPKFRGVKKGSKGTNALDAIAYLHRLTEIGRDAEQISGRVNTFFGQPTRGTARYLTWGIENRKIKFGGDGKRFWNGKGDPTNHLIHLWNGIARPGAPTEIHSHMHPLPWEMNDIKIQIKEEQLNNSLDWIEL